VEQHNVKIVSIKHATHDVLRIFTEKPRHFHFMPGQAANVSINKEGWQTKKRPLTFTSVPDQDYLEFTVKTYPSHKGVTNELLNLKTNDELILHDIFGEIKYRGEGVFIAGGAGVTPFISIIRYLYSNDQTGNNRLIFANKTKADIILEGEFKKILGNNFINILSDEKVKGYANGQITADFIKAKSGGLNKIFYICGPPPMMDSVKKQLADLNVDDSLIVMEAF